MIGCWAIMSVRHLHVGSGALGVGADEFFTGTTVAHWQHGRDEVEHLQGVGLVLVEEVHAVGNLHDIGAVRVRVVLQDELRGSKH